MHNGALCGVYVDEGGMRSGLPIIHNSKAGDPASRPIAPVLSESR